MTENSATGPRTPEGKAKSAQNATKHGLQAQQLLPNENPEAFAQLRECYFSQHPPRTIWEFDILEEMVWDKWMKFRHRHTEKAVLTLLTDPKSLDVDPAYAPLARAFIQNAGPDGVLQLLHRYGVAISRSYLRHLRELQRLRPDAFGMEAPSRSLPLADARGPENPDASGAATVRERQALGTPSASDGQSPAEQSQPREPLTPKFPNELPPLATFREDPRDSITNHREWPILKNLLFTATKPYPEATASILSKLRELPA